MIKKLGYFVLSILVVFVVIYFLNGGMWESKDGHSVKEGLAKTHQKKSIIQKGNVYRLSDDKVTIEKTIEKMSLDEKIGQMIFSGISGTTLTDETKSLLEKYKVGGIILFGHNIEGSQQTIDLLNQIKTENIKSNLPVFFGIDQEGGRVERLPEEVIKLPANKVIGAKQDEQLSYDIGTVLGEQLNTFGFNINFAPVLDVNSNPDNPVIGDRAFGDNPKIVSKLGTQTMKGMQSKNVISVIKHFPGHGDTSVDSHFELPQVNKSLKMLHGLELIPFKQAIEAGADVIMTAHILLPQIDPKFPASMSEKVITGILREELEFNGVVITDDMTMQAITNNFEMGHAAVESIKAGTDIILMAHDYKGLISTFDMLKEAVQTGEISEERINESVRRIIDLKWKYEIKDEQVETIEIEELNEMIENVLQK